MGSRCHSACHESVSSDARRSLVILDLVSEKCADAETSVWQAPCWSTPLEDWNLSLVLSMSRPKRQEEPSLPFKLRMQLFLAS